MAKNLKLFLRNIKNESTKANEPPSCAFVGVSYLKVSIS